jgi:hypothetical protein
MEKVLQNLKSTKLWILLFCRFITSSYEFRFLKSQKKVVTFENIFLTPYHIFQMKVVWLLTM